MKKAFKNIGIVFGIFFLLFVILFAGIKYRTTYAKTELTTFLSPNQEYQLTVYHIGEPDWPFGETHCRFVLYKGEKKIIKCDFSIHNDGAWAQEGNFTVQWKDDSVEILVTGEEQGEASYVLSYDGKKK